MEQHKNRITIEWEEIEQDGKKGFALNVDADINASLWEVEQVLMGAIKDIQKGMLQEMINGNSTD